MNIVTIDFETFYGDGYTLSSMTTEEYIRDPRFEAILLSFKVNDQPSFFVPRDLIPQWLEKLRLHECAVIMHHAHFDAGILNYHYDVRPKVIIDTLSMGRALHGANGRLSLEKLAERYGIGAKGKEVLNARNMRFADFGTEQLKRYGQYSCNDSDLTRLLATRMMPQFSKEELQIIDRIVRMFTEPELVLDTVMLQKYADDIHASKMAIMLQAGVQRADLMSNDKFAQALKDLGIDPPMKISPAWLKKPEEERTGNGLTYAFAKTDPAIQALQEHPDERVQILVEARLQNKTTIAEKGALRLISMAGRGGATVYLKYSGASGTHRLCLTGDTIITVMRSGFVLDIPLSSLDNNDLVWDSEDFVPHGGLIDQGVKPVITYQGITGTPDHRVYCDEVDDAIELRTASERGYTIKACPRAPWQQARVSRADSQCCEPEV